MGNCFTVCIPKSDTIKTFGNLHILSQHRNVDFTSLLQEDGNEEQYGRRNFLTRIFRKRRNKQKPVLQLVDGILNPQLTSYSRLSDSQGIPSSGSCTSRDIQLQCLDARALLQRTATSTPASSLDLEWEHETLPVSTLYDPSGSSWTAIPEDGFSHCPSNTSPMPTGGGNSESDWSRISSANSLEWDNVQNSIQVSPPLSEMDADTQLLLCEIERLTNKTLEETGQDLFS
ncbi:unnamed protein product [Acanthoscelides obtectus]|uniref:Uncharacterized protein n=1 Tax=Acanthoscelides obtectus TaxID=200917 RepID=A0A9P0P2Y3_ACAOB|nr:unnamed protein product [Acanthoscelides obtectus]CAK1666842.1 hypothetical protein AOBTE_LOCUS25516 [Acanthoscelides obtectus]